MLLRTKIVVILRFVFFSLFHSLFKFYLKAVQHSDIRFYHSFILPQSDRAPRI